MEVEVDAHVDAAVAEMSVEGAGVVVLVEERANVAQIAAEFFGSDSGVVPALPLGWCAGSEGSGAGTALAQIPDDGGLLGRVETHGGRVGHLLEAGHEVLSEVLRMLAVVGAEFDEQDAPAGWEQIDVGCALAFEAFDDGSFEAFEADGLKFEDFDDVVGCGECVRITECNQGSMAGIVNELYFGFEDDDAGAFGSDQASGDVEAIFG